MRQLLHILPLIAAAAGVGAGGAWASDVAVRVGFVLNFGRFAEWREAGLGPVATVNFCIAPGDSEMAAEFVQLERQRVHDRPVKVIQVAHPADVTRCHVLYLPMEMAGALSPWLDAADRSATLTVSDRPDFVEEGGMIGLVLVTGRYRFDINLAAVKRADLRLSAKLLSLARSVK